MCEICSFIGLPCIGIPSVKKERGIIMSEKRKTHTSTEVKARYNKKVYDTISIRVPKELSATFKEKCTKENVSQAQVIKTAIEEFLNK